MPGKIILECPQCQHVHKKNIFCHTCATDRPWAVRNNWLVCEHCHHGWQTKPCEACSHTIPMIDDFVKFYPDYVEFGGSLPAIIKGCLENSRYNLILEIVNTSWIQYELPMGYSLTEPYQQALKQRNEWLFKALGIGFVVGGIVGSIVGVSLAENVTGLIAALPMMVGSMLLTGIYAYWWGGKEKSPSTDNGLIFLASIGGALMVPMVIGGAIMMMVIFIFIAMFSDT